MLFFLQQTYNGMKSEKSVNMYVFIHCLAFLNPGGYKILDFLCMLYIAVHVLYVYMHIYVS